MVEDGGRSKTGPKGAVGDRLNWLTRIKDGARMADSAGAEYRRGYHLPIGERPTVLRADDEVRTEVRREAGRRAGELVDSAWTKGKVKD